MYSFWNAMAKIGHSRTRNQKKQAREENKDCGFLIFNLSRKCFSSVQQNYCIIKYSLISSFIVWIVVRFILQWNKAGHGAYEQNRSKNMRLNGNWRQITISFADQYIIGEHKKWSKECDKCLHDSITYCRCRHVVCNINCELKKIFVFINVH